MVPGEWMQLEAGTDNYKDVCDWLRNHQIEAHHDGNGFVTITSEMEDLFVRPGEIVLIDYLGCVKVTNIHPHNQ
jgi:hypothetical protein